MIIDDDAHDGFHHFALFVLGGGNLKCRAAARRQFHTVKGELQALAVLRHDFAEHILLCENGKSFVVCILHVFLVVHHFLFPPVKWLS